jgi:methionine-gamma-lyase
MPGRADLFRHDGHRHPALTFVRPGDVGPLWPAPAATETIINKILTQFGVQYIDFLAGETREELDEVMARAAKGRVSLIYLESSANPTNALVDVEAVAARAAAFGDQSRANADRNRQYLSRPQG